MQPIGIMTYKHEVIFVQSLVGLKAVTILVQATK